MWWLWEEPDGTLLCQDATGSGIRVLPDRFSPASILSVLEAFEALYPPIAAARTAWERERWRALTRAAHDAEALVEHLTPISEALATGEWHPPLGWYRSLQGWKGD